MSSVAVPRLAAAEEHHAVLQRQGAHVRVRALAAVLDDRDLLPRVIRGVRARRA